MISNHMVRALFRSIIFFGLVGGALLFNLLSDSHRDDQRRFLTVDASNPSAAVEEPCESLPKAASKAMLVPYGAGVLYMFFAIAVVCDEYFVPALEEIASERFLNLSMDVAGATLMAAGGSAPELFTSLIGTFKLSDVGFGTIVGSAVFNVLFVIGMCAIFSKETLTLTWWPLARDCTYYSIGLLVLAVFSGYSSPGRIELWEAVVQFSLYFGYVLLMKFNARIHSFLTKGSAKRISSTDNPGDGRLVAIGERRNSVKPSTFRAGLLKLFIGRKRSIADKVGIGMIGKISGNAKFVFDSIDENRDGFIDLDELRKLFVLLKLAVADDEVVSAMKELDDNGDGKIDLQEFTKWYTNSRLRLKADIRETFTTYDVNKSGTIDRDELKQMIRELGDGVTDEDVQDAFRETFMMNANDEITLTDFEDWYTQPDSWVKRKSQVKIATDDVDGAVSDLLRPPKGEGFVAYIKWIVLLPIVAMLCFTIPDVRQPGKSKMCFLSFLVSILWIGVFSFVMVEWTEVIGNTLGIPMVVMGLTLLAAGTSVPDLLSSVIVARRGEGDMAVSSSIGSNIFDITVGLPLPWILFSLWPNNHDFVTIGTNGMEISIIILLIMLIVIITMIHFSGWKMTKWLGAGMLVLYFVYLAQAIYMQLPFTGCI